MNFESIQKLNLDHKPNYKHKFITLLVENIEEKSLWCWDRWKGLITPPSMEEKKQ